jgi:hypothetical protein
MAKHVIYNASVVVNGVDLSDHVESVGFEVGINKQDAAAMGDIQDYGMPGTQIVSPVTITFYADFAGSKVYATLFPLWQNRTIFNIVGKATSGARTATNPEWTIPSFIGKTPLMTGKRGDRHMAPVTCEVGGVLSVLTA